MRLANIAGLGVRVARLCKVIIAIVSFSLALLLRRR